MGNHPQMAQLFRLVKYYNLPRSILDLANEHSENLKLIKHGGGEVY